MSIGHLAVGHQDLVEHSEQMVLQLDVFELMQVGEINLLELEFDRGFYNCLFFNHQILSFYIYRIKSTTSGNHYSDSNQEIIKGFLVGK